MSNLGLWIVWSLEEARAKFGPHTAANHRVQVDWVKRRVAELRAQNVQVKPYTPDLDRGVAARAAGERP